MSASEISNRKPRSGNFAEALPPTPEITRYSAFASALTALKDHFNANRRYKLSDAEIAEGAGINKGHLSRILAGESMPSRDVLFFIALSIMRPATTPDLDAFRGELDYLLSMWERMHN